MVNWLELIEEKEDQILAEGEKAYKEAINNPHLRENQKNYLSFVFSF